MRPQRIFDRANRVAAGLDNNPHPKVLEEFNNRQEKRFLHATKGYRPVNMKRLRANMIMNEMRIGNIPPHMISIVFQVGAIIRGEKPV